VNEALLVCVVLAVIYLFECVAWGPAEACAFHARPRGVWDKATELFAVIGDRWHAYAGSILPGSGGVAWAESRRMALSPAGVCACGSHASGTSVPYEGLGRIHANGRALKADSRMLGRAATAGRAKELAALVEQLASVPRESRATLIETDLAGTLDARRARRALRRYRWCAKELVWPERVLAMSMFVLLPAALLLRGFRSAWPESLLTLALTVFVTVLYVVRIRRLARTLPANGPTASISDHALTMLLAPPAAIRADDAIARDACSGLHAVAIARAAGSPTIGRETAAGALRELVFPLESERAACCDASVWSREAWGRILRAWVTREFGSVESLLAPPARETDAMRSHCPRCLSQYSRAGGDCDECPGVALVGFEA